jgi:A/G-specific adenine glycosylase
MSSREVAAFRRNVWSTWKKHGRHELPWRKTKDPYRILVSEIMLQQTQVPRVIPKYAEFLKAFPTVSTLAQTPLREVLKHWSGLGYNRRGKYLQDAAKSIVEKHGGRVPKDAAALRALPGVGVYTAAAVRVFAFNEPDTLVETNVRTAIIYSFFQRGRSSLKDSDIALFANIAANGQDPREWNWALMDYGAFLKQSGVRLNARSAHYVRQKKFEGSIRQLRGQLIRALHTSPKSDAELYSLIRANRRIVLQAQKGLEKDGLIARKNGKWRIA